MPTVNKPDGDVYTQGSTADLMWRGYFVGELRSTAHLYILMLSDSSHTPPPQWPEPWRGLDTTLVSCQGLYLQSLDGGEFQRQFSMETTPTTYEKRGEGGIVKLSEERPY